MFPCWSLASQQIRAGSLFHRAYSRLSWPVSPFQGRSWADALAGCLPFLGLAGILSSSRYITGTLYVAIEVPFVCSICFLNLAVLSPPLVWFLVGSTARIS